MRFRLLPEDHPMGWAPYGYLVYLSFFVLPVAWSSAGGGLWFATLAGVALFLGLYFRAWWAKGREVLPWAWAIVALGAGFYPWNPGAACFFIYAAAFVAEVPPSAAALRWIAAIVAVGAVESLLLRMPLWGWFPAVIIPALIGATNVHYAESRRAKDRLLRAQAEVQHLAQVAERERIGRDLHDLLGHTLSVVVLKSELAGKLAGLDPERSLAEIRDVERIARQALGEVRSAVEGYRSRSLDEELAGARAALDAAGVALTARIGARSLPPAVESVLAMTLREAVTNVVRHAAAQRCVVSLELLHGEARLEVCDDGRGGEAPEGHGLTGMRERLAALGGRLERTGAREGTRLVALVPISPAVDEPAAERVGLQTGIPAAVPMPGGT